MAIGLVFNMAINMALRINSIIWVNIQNTHYIAIGWVLIVIENIINGYLIWLYGETLN